MGIINYCNANQGFMSALLALFSVLVSIIAICISISVTRKQNRIALFEKKYEAYNMISGFLSSMQIYDGTPESVETILIKLFSFSNFGVTHIENLNEPNAKTQLVFLFATYLEKIGLLFGDSIEKEYKEIDKYIDLYVDTLFFYTGGLDNIDEKLSIEKATLIIPKSQKFCKLLASEAKI